MKTSKYKIIGIFLLLGVSKLATAQFTIPPEVVDNYVDGITTDFNTYMGSYMNPLLKGIGYGFNNGWYNTARPHKSFGFDLTISANLAYVPTADQVFTFNPDNYTVLDLADPTDNVLPTVMGGSTTTEVISYLDKGNPISPYVQVPVLDGVQDQLSGLPIEAIAVPSPIIQLGVGIFKGTEVKVRWVPTIQNDQGIDYNYFGLGVMHNVSQWVPVLKDLKFLDVSGFIGFTNIDLNYELGVDSPLDGINQAANFGVNTITYEVVGSATVSVLTGYVGLGFDSFKTNLNMNGDYYVRIPGTDTGAGEAKQTITDPVDLNAKDGGFRATVGARLKLAILTLHANYTLQEYNTLNVGVGFSFR